MSMFLGYVSVFTYILVRQLAQQKTSALRDPFAEVFLYVEM